MRLLKASGHRRTPWKNGGGETAEIAVHPAGAGLDTFDWRVSMARVAADGPFSIFPDVDRTLCVIEGNGLDLDVGYGECHRLTQASEPLLFRGDAPTAARLLDGPILDFNVMTRRGRWRHEVRRVGCDAPAVLDPDAGPAMVFCSRGSVVLDLWPSRLKLDRHDALLLDGRVPRLSIPTAAASLLYVVLLDRTPA